MPDDAAPAQTTADFTQLVKEISALADRHGLTVGAAESLTGGAITSALAAGPSAADWCRGGVVAYMPSVKFDLLGVTPGPLITEACAAQMAAGAAKVLEADVVVSTTGAGGPDEEEGHPPGTAVIGVAIRGESTTHWAKVDGEPEEVVHRVRDEALALLLAGLRELAD